MMYDYIIRSGLPFIVLTNKADKIAVTKVTNAVKDIQDILQTGEILKGEKSGKIDITIILGSDYIM